MRYNVSQNRVREYQVRAYGTVRVVVIALLAVLAARVALNLPSVMSQQASAMRVAQSWFLAVQLLVAPRSWAGVPLVAVAIIATWLLARRRVVGSLALCASVVLIDGLISVAVAAAIGSMVEIGRSQMFLVSTLFGLLGSTFTLVTASVLAGLPIALIELKRNKERLEAPGASG